MQYQFNSTRRDAAKFLGISDETVKRWEYSGKIPAHVYVKLAYKTQTIRLQWLDRLRL
jgi:predicted site-specific integrase-resolvase